MNYVTTRIARASEASSLQLYWHDVIMTKHHFSGKIRDVGYNVQTDLKSDYLYVWEI